MKIFAGFILLLISFGSRGFELVSMTTQKGKSRPSFPVIVLPQVTNPITQHALTVFQDALAKMSIPAFKTMSVIEYQSKQKSFSKTQKVFFGLTELPQIDAFQIKTDDYSLTLNGGPRKGVVYAVTTFFEDYLNCLVFSPTEYRFTAWNQKSNIFIPYSIDRTEQPAFDVRMVNGPYNDSEFYKDWRKLYGIGDFWYKGYYVHTFNKLVDPKEHFEAHPEYFSLVGGKRIPFGQLCLSNPAVRELIIQNLGKEIQAHPDYRIWSVSQNDCYYNCECENCKKIDQQEGSPAGLMLQLVNQVAEAFPQQIITTLAYQYTRKPPKITKPAKNVWVTLCSIELDRSADMLTHPGSKSFVDDLQGWAQLGGGTLKIWDYTVQFTNYLCPFPNLHTLQSNVQLFSKNNVSAVFEQGNARNGVEWAQYKSYLLSQWLWNPNVREDQIRQKFLSAYYGPAAEEIQAYQDILHRNAKETKQGLDIYGSPAQYKNTFLNSNFITLYETLFSAALAATQSDSAFHARVKVAHLPIQYSRLEIAKTELFGPRGFYEEKNGTWMKKEEMANLLEDFHQTCSETGTWEFDENGMNAEKYYVETKKATQVSVEGNAAFHQLPKLMPASDPRYTGEGAARLSDGVHGTTNWKLNWLGWEGKDVSVEMPLNQPFDAKTISLGVLSYPKSWIIFPETVQGWVQKTDGKWIALGENKQMNSSMQDATTFDYSFAVPASVGKIKAVKFEVVASKELPLWHPYHGNKSWLFLDEIEVK